MIVNSLLFDHTNAGTTQYSTRLSGNANEQFGLAKSISVMPGDTVRAEVFAKYLDTNSSNWTPALTNFMAAIAGGTAPAGTVVDGGASGSTGGDIIPLGGLLDKSSETGTAPKAYLNYIIFDREYNVINGGFVRMTTNAREYGQDAPHEKLSAEMRISQAGYVYMYLSNDNVSLGGGQVETYWDDFTVEHVKSPIVQLQDYYAFGTALHAYNREDAVANSFLYNGGSELNSTTNNYEMLFREYDPILGRMTAVDPMASKYASLTPYNYAFNDPVYFNDPSGADPYGDDDNWWNGPRSTWAKWSTGGPSQWRQDQKYYSQDQAARYGNMYGGEFSSGGGYFGKLGLSHSPTIEFGFNSAGEAGYWLNANSGTHTGLSTNNGTIYLQGDVVISSRFVKIDGDNQQNNGGVLLGAASTTLAFITTDATVPDPSDAVLVKWLGYAIAGTIAGGIIYYAGKGNKNYPGPLSYTIPDPTSIPKPYVPPGKMPDNSSGWVQKTLIAIGAMDLMRRMGKQNPELSPTNWDARPFRSGVENTINDVKSFYNDLLYKTNKAIYDVNHWLK